MPEQTKLAASGSTPPPRQITSLRRLPEVADASKSIFGVRKNPSWAGNFGILRKLRAAVLLWSPG